MPSSYAFILICSNETGKYYESRDINMNFSIKDGLKIVSKTKTKNCRFMIDQGLHCA